MQNNNYLVGRTERVRERSPQGVLSTSDNNVNTINISQNVVGQSRNDEDRNSLSGSSLLSTPSVSPRLTTAHPTRENITSTTINSNENSNTNISSLPLNIPNPTTEPAIISTTLSVNGNSSNVPATTNSVTNVTAPQLSPNEELNE